MTKWRFILLKFEWSAVRMWAFDWLAALINFPISAPWHAFWWVSDIPENLTSIDNFTKNQQFDRFWWGKPQNGLDPVFVAHNASIGTTVILKTVFFLALLWKFPNTTEYNKIRNLCQNSLENSHYFSTRLVLQVSYYNSQSSKMVYSNEYSTLLEGTLNPFRTYCGPQKGRLGRFIRLETFQIETQAQQ